MVAGLTGLLAIVALASRSGRAEGDVPSPSLPPELFELALTFGTVALAVAFLVLVWRLAHMPWQPSPAVRGIVRWRLASSLLVLLLTLVTLRAIHFTPPSGRQSGLPRKLPLRTVPAEPEGRSQRPIRFRWELAAVAGGLALGGLGAWLVLRRRRALSPLLELGEEELSVELSVLFDETLGDLRREPDPRRAVIAAYARAEAILARYGLPRWPFEAPLEYLSRVLEQLRVRASAGRELTDLFERAKFSRHEIDQGMKAEAIAALVAVRDDLRAGSQDVRDRLEACPSVVPESELT